MVKLKVRIGLWLLLCLLTVSLVGSGGVRAQSEQPPTDQDGQTAQQPPTSKDSPNKPTITGCQPAWYATGSPSTGVSGHHLNAVAARTSNDVWAVGSYRYGNYKSNTLVQHWDGSSWTILDSPSPGREDNELLAVSAVSSNDVWAVGYYYYDFEDLDALALHWDGNRWQQFDVPAAPRNDYLTAVAAVSSNNVWAVGYRQDQSNLNNSFAKIIHWNGTSWQGVVIPQPGERENVLTGLSVVSASEIWAVGYYRNASGGPRPMALRWDGTSWTQVATASQPVTGFNAVAARNGSDVLAVGGVISEYGAIFGTSQRWNGSSWQLTNPPYYADSTLNDVAVTGRNDGWAVGKVASDTLLLRWNGSAWQRTTAPNPGSLYNTLNGVALVSSSDGWAVGSYSDGSNPESPLLLRWTGSTWTQVASPTRSGTVNNRLADVVAINNSTAWAVGSYGERASQPLIQRWNGSSWQLAATPLINAYGYLYSVDASGPNDVWAVGLRGVGYEAGSPLAMRWDGSNWSVVAAAPLTTSAGFNAVAAVAPDAAWAVGWINTSQNSSRVLIQYWDGTLWSNVPTPNSGRAYEYLNDVVAVSRNDVWAVGTTRNYTTNDEQPLVMHWNGTNWQIIPTADLGFNNSGSFFGVTATGGDAVWAVGGQATGFDPGWLVERWNGTAWQITSRPTNGTYFSKVTAAGVGNLWAIGTQGRDNPLAITARGDGTTWVTTTLPSPRYTRLEGIDAVSSNDVWAVGNYADESLTKPVILHYSDQPTFSDVPPTNIFYTDIQFLACRGAISGYADGSFQPNAATTRGQFAKIATLAFSIPAYTPPTPTFSDVPINNVFYPYIEAINHAGAITGYGDGTFRPNQNITRAQLTKIVALARSYSLLNPSTPTYADVPSGSFFYRYVETLSARSIISGANCASGAGRCFRPDDEVRRGELSKVVRRAVESAP